MNINDGKNNEEILNNEDDKKLIDDITNINDKLLDDENNKELFEDNKKIFEDDKKLFEDNKKSFEDNKKSFEDDKEIFEKDHVHKFYSDFASDFNITRVRTWPKISKFLIDNDEPHFINLDNGCGNGRNLNINHTGNFIGLDYSLELLKFSKNVLRGDCLSLPFKDLSFNIILSIAVIHHFSTKERRKKAMEEMYRCLKKSGKILLYVWDESTNYKSKFKRINNKDYFVRFNDTFDRYYYLYDKEELEEFCRECGFKIEECGIEQESIYIILTK